MEQFKKVLSQLINTLNLGEFIEQRKKQCLEENENNSKQNPKQFGEYGKKKITINRTKTIVGIQRSAGISASSDFIEEGREVVISGNGLGTNVNIVTGNIDDVYIELFESIKKQDLENIDTNQIIQIVYQTVNKYFGAEGRVDRYQFLNEEHFGTNTLSDLKGKNLAACVERALLSQNLFKMIGIDSTIKQSDIINNGNQDSHAYNILRIANKNYIYDSAMAKVVNGKKTEPIVGTISDEEYMLIIDGTSRYGAKTKKMENGIIYDSSFNNIDEELKKLTPEEIEAFKRQAKLKQEHSISENKDDKITEANILDLFNQGKLLTRAMEPASLYRDSRTGKIYYDFSGVGAEINEAKNKGKEATSTSLIIPGNKMHTYRANGFFVDSKKTEILHISATDSGSNGAKDKFWASGDSLASLEELARTIDIGKNNPMNEINVNMKENAYIGIFTGRGKHNTAHGIIMQKVAEMVLGKKLPIYEYDDMQGKLTNLELSSEDKIAIIKECLGDYKFRSKDVYYEIDGQEFSFDILEELEKENKKSVLESSEEALAGITLRDVNKAAETINKQAQKTMNPDIEKDSNDLGVDD